MDRTIREVYQEAINRLYDEMRQGMINPDRVRALIEATESLSDQYRREYGG